MASLSNMRSTELSSSPATRKNSSASLMLERFLQDETTVMEAQTTPRVANTARLPTSKTSDTKPRLLLMGRRRSGKSSISNVVFHKMPPTETLYLASTAKIMKDSLPSFMEFQVWDFPGEVNFLDPAFDAEDVFGENCAVIWVIDSQDDYLNSLNQLHNTVIHLQQSYPHVIVEVFIHKVDGLSDDYKMDTQRDILQRTQDELSDAGYDENINVNFHLTSIYDHSIFQAFSKVIQKLIPQLATLEGLLNNLQLSSGMEKTYLFDVHTKIYIATDATPVDIQSYEICSDYIDVILDISDIYGRSEKTREITEGDEDDDEGYQEAESVIRLANGMNLYLREINRYLALICLMREESIKKKGLVDYNVGVFQNAIANVFDRSRLPG